MDYIAHTSEDGREQSVEDHLRNTAKLASQFAKEYGMDPLAYAIGLCHDLGKYSCEFQKRIRGANIRVDHATAGGQRLTEINQGVLGRVAAYCIFGHHGGLPNGGTKSDKSGEGTLHSRLQKHLLDYNAYRQDINLDDEAVKLVPLKDFTPDQSAFGFSVAFMTRMLFSALVDADWIDTETFVRGKKSDRGDFASLETLLDKLNSHLADFQEKADKSDLNAKRSELLAACIKKAASPRGLFSLTAPTGSGKTLSSAAFGLNHAVKNGHSRIIYVVPYNTIIEQNAEVFENIFGKENVLQHHSGVHYESDEDHPEYRRLLATENWDAPLIVTSSVRFFEGLYGNKPSACRKLHNIANSVIVLDEAQMIPLPYLIPCVMALRELVMNYNCTVVLATATQSSLDEYFKPIEVTEIVPNPREMYELFRRVTYVKLEALLSDEDLVNMMRSHDQALCVVNTRKKAQLLTGLLEEALIEDMRQISGEYLRHESNQRFLILGIYHLSTTMVPVHRTLVLNEIREKLYQGETCRVISTSMIEAGVDVNFPFVYREEAGLDSVIQAGGRCNREGKRAAEDSIVYIFTMHDSAQKHISQNIAAYEHAARNNEDIASLDAIESYFKQLRYIIGKEGLDKDSAVKLFNEHAQSLSFPFKDVAEKFKLIEDSTRMVIVPFDENASALIARLRKKEYSRELFRSLQQYSVSLYENDIKKLMDIGALERLIKDEGEILILGRKYYDDRYGVTLSPKGGMAEFA